jgi:hypothetical protein
VGDDFVAPPASEAAGIIGLVTDGALERYGIGRDGGASLFLLLG